MADKNNKERDYYNLFPDCEKCHNHRLIMNCASNPFMEELAESAYARHLMENHKLSRLDICDKTGVFIC